MRHFFLILTMLAYLPPPASKAVIAQEAGSVTRRARRDVASRTVNSEGREAAERALARLRVLRDGWNDVNRQFIKQDFVAAQRLDGRDYQVQYLEAKAVVGEALQILPKGELRTAIEQAMDIFDDLEAITKIFNKTSPFTTNVRVVDIFPYLKKYNVPYESGVTRTLSGLTLHQDFVMSYILPLRYARVNRIEVLLGGKAKPIPPPPTYEQMFHVPAIKPPIDRSSVSVESLKGMVRQAIEARVRGNQSLMRALLDDQFMFYALQGRQWDRERFLRSVSPDSMVKGFEIEQAELSFRQEAPVLTTVVRYESLRGEFKSFNNTFTFVNRNGKWLIIRWRAF
jgi:hypothetical protein